MHEDLLHLIKERGILLEKALYDLLRSFDDVTFAKEFLERLERAAGQKMITATVLTKNASSVKHVIDSLSGEKKTVVENVLVKMGISLEVEHTTTVQDSNTTTNTPTHQHTLPYKLHYGDTNSGDKIEVKDFVGHFRARYRQIQRMLLGRPDLKNLMSINKLTRNRQAVSIIGMVTEKRLTKNKNLIITFEDLTGSVSGLVKVDSDSFSIGKELQMDDIVAIKASGNNEMLFIHEIHFPDAHRERTRFDEEFLVGFISDIHAGSNKHLGKEFERFIEWTNSDDPLAKKLRYVFIVGDNVDGVGVFPGQEAKLDITHLQGQYDLLASYLARVPNHITMFMVPGQHDSVRVAEPQPVIDDYYGKALYDIDNLVLVPNPTQVSLVEGEKEFKVLMYHGGAIHPFINNIEELRLMKAHKCPAKAVRHMLKRRHLAPMHGVSPQIIYVPNTEADPMVIQEVPDVLCTGEVHRLDIETYNGVLIITGSCWQAQTDFEEKVGNVPDPCKVPLLNVKTRELKILDFSEPEEDLPLAGNGTPLGVPQKEGA